MTKDPIVEEVRSVRQRLLAACHEDLNALMDRFQEQEALDRDRLVFHVPPKTNQASKAKQPRSPTLPADD